MNGLTNGKEDRKMKRKFAPFFRFISISAIFALLFVSITLDGKWITSGAAEAADPAIEFSINNPGIQKAIEVQNRNSKGLMSIPGVVGHGVGISEYDEPVIKIFVARDGIPGLPKVLEGIPTKVVFTGMIVAYADPTAKFSRPVPIGVSTGHPDITAGTIGCRVTDGTDVYALSNNHVYANQNDAKLGDNVLQPGPYDGGQNPADTIGTLYAFAPINFSGGNNTMDAAIALSSEEYLGTTTPDDGYGTPNSTTTDAKLKMTVQKYGRTTGWTRGEVAEINVTVDVCYEVRGLFFCVKQARFVGQIGISPGTFSSGGDSGSLIVTDDVNINPVGLLFAGGSTRTFANPIGAVLEAFNVSVDDGDSSPPLDNQVPTASFTYTTSDITATFTDTSTDSDGSIVSWSWAFGDGATSTAQNPSHTYAAAGTYMVTLEVTDDDGATGSVSESVTVSDSSAVITLTATGYKVKGRQKADLEWTGAASDNVDIYRNEIKINDTNPIANDGFYTDNIDKVGGGSYIYKVCEAGTTTCSSEATVTF
jgi:PKD repeat protein